MNYINNDKKYIWHPFTQEKTADPPICIVKACGTKLYDETGKEYLDLVSSWWVNVHGHTHPYITNAITNQAKTLEHVIFAGFTHPPAIELTTALRSHLPPTLNKFFFSDNGSTSIEIALKISYQYWKNNGEKNRNRFIAFNGGYHGDTFGCMATGKSSGFFNHFTDLLFKVDFMPYPATWINDEKIEQKEHKALSELKRYLDKYSNETVALIIEPLVQGASGMSMIRSGFLEDITKLAKSYNILVIFDEVMTGFGRTGKMFALNHINITPDIICISKGLTGGFLPLALTVCTQKIYDVFLDNDFLKGFTHGHSYTANPLGCAAAIASLELFTKEHTLEKISKIEKIHQKYLSIVKQEIKSATKMRICGSIAAFTIDIPQTNNHFFQRIKHLCLKKRVIIRPLGNNIYLLPPYCITKEELVYSYKTLLEILQTFIF